MQARTALTLVSLVLAPPLAPLVWVFASGRERSAYLRSSLVRAGLACMALSALPLLVVGVFGYRLGLTSDPNPNPVGLGLLFIAGVTIGGILIAIGAFLMAGAIRRGEA